jgi:dTDP-glucose 4,6-dehydratase
MRVLVTGAVGFIGHYVIQKLINDTDYDIIGLERLSYSGNLNRLSEINVNARYKSVHHDLKSPINDILSKQIGDVDYIIHIAASSHVDRSIEDPLSFVMDNVVGTCNILNFARTQKSLKMFLYFSTDEVFGPAPEGVKYDEYDRYNSTNPYSASKAGGEELCVAFRNTYSMPVVVTHTMNVFGNRQHPEKYIPKCIRSIDNGETLYIHSDSTKTNPGSRHYIHGEDVADAIIFLMKNENCLLSENNLCPKFNVVGQEELNNLELAQIIAEVINKPLKYEFVDFHTSRPGHDLRYAIAGDRLARLGWVPKVSVRERVREVVEWSLNHSEWI